MEQIINSNETLMCVAFYSEYSGYVISFLCDFVLIHNNNNILKLQMRLPPISPQADPTSRSTCHIISIPRHRILHRIEKHFQKHAKYHHTLVT